MTEEKSVSRPRQLWDTALKTVKGENTTELVEQFTSEMTLVAEGLCEDQARLRGEIDDLRREQDRIAQRSGTAQENLDHIVAENRREVDDRLESLTRRIEALEARTSERAAARQEKQRRQKDIPLIRGLIWLAGIIGGSWVIVTLLNLLKGA